MKRLENKNRMAQKNKQQKSKEETVQQKGLLANKQSGDGLNNVIKLPGIMDMRKKKNQDLI